jgi:hypothetical protein
LRQKESCEPLLRQQHGFYYQVATTTNLLLIASSQNQDNSQTTQATVFCTLGISFVMDLVWRGSWYGLAPITFGGITTKKK